MVLKISALILLATIIVDNTASPVVFKRDDSGQPTPVAFIANVTSTTEQLNPSSVNCAVKLTEAQMKSGTPGENYRWRSGFYVQMDSRFSAEEVSLINNALYELSTNICIQILVWPQDSNPSGDYVFINRGESGTGCWSYVGRLGGRQELNLEAPGCVHHGVTIHESIHALGFFHEQSRPDRDDFVDIHWQNIIPEYQYAYDKYSDTLTFNVPYDYTSIMHYNRFDFSSNGQETIRAKNGQPIGSEQVLTNYDRQKLQQMYNC